MNSSKKRIAYTLDLEEDHAGMCKHSYEGIGFLDQLLVSANEHRITLSVFVQGELFNVAPECIELMRESNCDIHVHSYSHPLKRYPADHVEIERSRDAYREFFGKDPIGYRFPQGNIVEDDYEWLKQLGFKFDSSVFPTLRPGYFNNLSSPLHPHFVKGILEIPFSVVSDIVRVPIALSYIKLFYPMHFLLPPKDWQSELIFDFHMHDLYYLKATDKMTFLRKTPYIRKRSEGVDLFLRYHDMLAERGYSSVPITTIYESAIESGEVL